MCGIAGIIDLRGEGRVDGEILKGMTRTIVHRGPNSVGYFSTPNVGLALTRLSIIDLEGGDQPIFNEDESLVLVCNGEIFGYRELRQKLRGRGHRFRTEGDVEVLLHLYEDQGTDFLEKLNAQFAFALYDRKRESVLLARDHLGINPLFYTVTEGLFIFGSEIKAILEHPAVDRRVDLTGLDQVLTFPGLVSPRTMFEGIKSLPAGRYLEVRDGGYREGEFWDLIYPLHSEETDGHPESYYVDAVRSHFFDAVKLRLEADVPVGFYLSGGLDSSLVAAAIHEISPGADRRSFSVDFSERNMSEAASQELVVRQVGSTHSSVCFDWEQTRDRLRSMIYHCECPVRETYNTCTLALSEMARDSGVPVILTGEGADELFAGYVGYRWDQSGLRSQRPHDLETILEDEMRERLWGERNLIYETEYHALGEVKQALYSPDIRRHFEDFDCLRFEIVNKDRVRGRHPVHQRSYLDYRLRLSDHLLADHGDRMALAHSVEGRHPFLDLDLVNFSTRIPSDLKVKNLQEKYILRQAASGIVPEQVRQREKFGWFSSGSAELLQRGDEWTLDMLSEERIRRLGYFDVGAVERLKKRYSKRGFRLNFPFESDLLMIVLSFNQLVELFDLPSLGS